MTIWYPDCSNNDWGSEDLTDEGQRNLLAFLPQLRGLGLAGVAHKMSQGTGYVDPYGALCRTWCADNKFPFIGYHYITTDPAASQVNNWLVARGGKNVMLDWEVGGGDLENFWNVVNAFNVAGVNVALSYMPQWYWNDQGAPDLTPIPDNGIALVSSAYPMGDSVGPFNDVYRGCDGDAGEGWASYGGVAPTIWQYTSTASIAGITCDCNAYHGTSSQLTQLFTGVTP